MSKLDQQLSGEFLKWEMRGRGWQVFPEPVFLEPPFVPFAGHYLPAARAIDDGRRPTMLSSFVERLSRKLSTAPPSVPVEPESDEAPDPTSLIRDSLIEFQASLPEKLDVTREAFEQFLSNLSLRREPIAFELLGTHKKVTAQFVAAKNDAPLLRRQLSAYFPEAVFISKENVLEEAFIESNGDEILAVEFGLAHEFMLPLASGKIDPFIGIVGALSELHEGELGLFQVMFQPVEYPWDENIVHSVTQADGKPFFINRPELVNAAENKVSKPLYAAVVRILIRTSDEDRLLQLARYLAGSLRVFSHPNGNELVPLHNDEYPFEEHIEDVLRRQTRRSGMILNSDELIGFVHLPGSAVRSSVFQRQSVKSKAAPNIVQQGYGLFLGTNEHAGQSAEVRLSAEQRVRHTHVIGATGTGKSSLLFNLISQDIKNSEGVAVLDPHGDLIDKILGVIPESRIEDVILVDPSDESNSIGFNILSAHSDAEKKLLASDLIAVFQRLSTSWGDQMNSVFQNAILAFLESDREGTIADLRKFLIEPAFRNEFLKSVKDSEIVYYWQKSFPHLSGNKSIGSILTRLDTLLAQKPIRNMVSQPKNKLDFAHIMDSGKIFLAKLPEGLFGRENSHLLGTLLISKFQQIAMSRQAQAISARRDYWIYIDEFASFISPSMAEILSGARKYRIGLTLAHHALQQLQGSPEVATAVMTHPYTRIAFRVGDDDAKKLAETFSFFEAKDLRNLETGHAIAKVERSDFDFNLSIPLPEMPNAATRAARAKEVITSSRKKYGTEQANIDALLTKVPQSATAIESPVRASDAPKTREALKTPITPVEVKTPSAVEPPKELLPARRESPKELGRGGEQHKAIQHRIKEAADALGFRSAIEKPILNGLGSVDLLLERGTQKIACEISLTTTIDHEVGNVAKCLKAGLREVAVICIEAARLKKIETAIVECLGKDAAVCVSFYKPDDFISHLQKLPAVLKTKSQPDFNEHRSRGHVVRLHVPPLSEEERCQLEEIALEQMKETMRRKLR